MQAVQLGKVWLEVKEIDTVYHARWIKFITTHKTIFVRLLRQLLAARQLVTTEPILGAEAVKLAEKELKYFVSKGHVGPYGNLLGFEKALERDTAIMRTEFKLGSLQTRLLFGAAAFRLRSLWLPSVTPNFVKPAFRKIGLL